MLKFIRYKYFDSCSKPKSEEHWCYMDSDSAIEFDQKLSAALKILSNRVIGEIAFQINRGILETIFQPGTSPSNGQSKKTRIYGYTS